MEKIIMPVTFIGEPDWIEKLTAFLESYDVEVRGLGGLSNELDLPESIVNYYTHFGGVESSDFMYSLYKPEQLGNLSQSQWSFIKENFTDEETEKYIVFAESPGNDPVCFDRHNFSIWLFCHDPLKKAKVFEDFNQYLRYEIIELQKLMGVVVFDDDDEMLYHQTYLPGNDIDYSFRKMKFL